MKFFILMSLSVFSLTAFGQGLIFSEDVDKLLPGPALIKIGASQFPNAELQYYSSAPRWGSPMESINPETSAIVAKLNAESKTPGAVTIACTGESNYYNGVVKVKRIDYCLRTSDGKLLYKSDKISDAQGLAIKSKIDRVIKNNEEESVVFAKPAAPEAEKPLSAVIDSALVKCADGSKKELLKMGRLNRTYNKTYIAKSNNQDFVTISPDGSVNLYYCAPKRIIWENGKQRQENIPVDTYAFSLGNLYDRDNCQFSDIISGTVNLRFQGTFHQTQISLRAIMGTDAEQKEFKKLCLDPNDERSFNVQDSPTGVAQ